MSLDVYLSNPVERTHECICTKCYNTHTRTEKTELYSANISHNLNKMASHAGLYEVLWRPESKGITHAAQLIEPLKLGLVELECDEARFRQYDAPNGWGRYEHLVAFVREYLAACEAHPTAEVSVSR